MNALKYLLTVLLTLVLILCSSCQDCEHQAESAYFELEGSLLNKSETRIPLSIRKILNKHNILAFFLPEKEFNSFVDRHAAKKDAVGLAFMTSKLILIDETEVIKCKYSQKEVNFLLLHETVHVILHTRDEELTDQAAVALAHVYNIPIKEFYMVRCNHKWEETPYSSADVKDYTCSKCDKRKTHNTAVGLIKYYTPTGRKSGKNKRLRLYRITSGPRR